MRWEKVKGIGEEGPGKRWGHTCNAVRDGKLLYLFGGYGKFNCQTNQVHVFDTQPREGHASVLVGKQLYVFGGCGRSADNINEVYYNDLYVLSTETFVWKRVITSSSPPSPRDSHTCSSWGNKIIVIGGEDENDSYLADVHILDTGQSLPPRAGHSTVSFGKHLFVFGGFTETQTLYNDLYMLDIATSVWTKVATTPNGPCARFSVAGDCLDPYMSGVLVFVGGCNRNLEALDDMHYLYTGIPRESEPRPEKLSLRKQLKLKCLEQNPNLVQNPVLCGYEVVNQSPTPGKKMFQAKVMEKSPVGYTIETVIDGRPLRGLLFLNHSNTPNPVPNTVSRKKTASDSRNVAASNGTHTNNVTTSKVLRQERMENRQELRGESSESLGRHKEVDTIVVSSNPTTAVESVKVSVNPEREVVSLNQNRDEKNDTQKSSIESLKNDGSNDVSSSKGEVQINNVSVSNHQSPRQMSGAPNFNADVLNLAAAESSVCLPNQGVTGDCTTPPPRTEEHNEQAKLT
ncbi:hypothetical protein VNO78_02756 [Psophocarpus tetragonolobus]|uniref:Uncharacterized protein n=1 Tax=Psophocarpus tetragonolobus TaxID=3891 RepID=A0AAN9T0D0_PSOTE